MYRRPLQMQRAPFFDGSIPILLDQYNHINQMYHINKEPHKQHIPSVLLNLTATPLNLTP